MRVGEFEKVSFEQFCEGVRKSQYGSYTDEQLKEIYDAIQLPTRATTGSAGYDLKSPMGFRLCPKAVVTIPTGIRCKMEDGWFLACYPRSGLGFKYKLRLVNVVGIIDQDYYYSDNEGHIFLKMCNEGYNEMTIEAGQGFAQGIFMPYGLTYSDDVSTARNGGMGSTDKK